MQKFGDVDFSDNLPYAILEDGEFLIVMDRCGNKAGFDGKHKAFIDIQREFGYMARGELYH